MAKTKVARQRAPHPNDQLMDWGWLTQVAFALVVALVLARATMLEVSSAGPAASLVLDLLCAVPALLVLARRVIDRTYIVRWTWSFVGMGLLALWMALSVTWSVGKFQAATAAAHFIAGLLILWSAAQLVRSWRRLRLVAAVLIGLLLLSSVHGIMYKFLDAPETLKYFQKDPDKALRDQGIEPGTFAAQQFEQKVRRAELMGFTASANSFAALVVMLMIVGAGWVVQRMRDREGPDPLLILIPAVLGLGLWMLAWAESRTAFAALVLGLLLLAVLWLGVGRLGARAGLAYVVGVVVVALGGAGVVAIGLARGNLIHSSLTFRWTYWIGSTRMLVAHPFHGVGWGNFPYYYLAVRVPEASEEIKDPHNFVVRFFVELGVVGGVIAIAWMLRMWWELTRPNLPTATPQARKSRPLLVVAGLCILAFAINLGASLDFREPGDYVVRELARRAMYFAALYLAAVATSVRSLENAEGDDRPAPWVLYGLLIAAGMFLLHNLVDFSLFETGPMMVFMLIAGSALGVRFGSVAGQRRRKLVPGISLTIGAVLWLVVAVMLAIPTAEAEQFDGEGREMMRAGRYREAEQVFGAAFERRQMNSEFAQNAAEAARLAHEPERRVKAWLSLAIKANPRVGAYYIRRAETELASAGPNPQLVEGDYRRASELNPNDVTLHLQFAQAMLKLGANDKAIEQYEAALKASRGMEKENPRRNDATVHLEYAKALEGMGRWQEALGEYQSALDYSTGLPAGDRRRISDEDRATIDKQIRRLREKLPM